MRLMCAVIVKPKAFAMSLIERPSSLQWSKADLMK